MNSRFITKNLCIVMCWIFNTQNNYAISNYRINGLRVVKKELFVISLFSSLLNSTIPWYALNSSSKFRCISISLKPATNFVPFLPINISKARPSITPLGIRLLDLINNEIVVTACKNDLQNNS